MGRLKAIRREEERERTRGTERERVIVDVSIQTKDPKRCQKGQIPLILIRNYHRKRGLTHLSLSQPLFFPFSLASSSSSSLASSFCNCDSFSLTVL